VVGAAVVVVVMVVEETGVLVVGAEVAQTTEGFEVCGAGRPVTTGTHTSPGTHTQLYIHVQIFMCMVCIYSAHIQMTKPLTESLRSPTTHTTHTDIHLHSEGRTLTSDLCTRPQRLVNLGPVHIETLQGLKKGGRADVVTLNETKHAHEHTPHTHTPRSGHRCTKCTHI
jgi:hypothetical protein